MGRRLGATPGPRKPETAVDVARNLPAPPPRPIADSPALIQEEEEVFARCEAAVETLKWAYWAAGKALQIIRDGRLYRVTAETFEDYCRERWDLSENYANKLIRTWRIAEAMFESESNGSVPIGTARKVNQAQVWELVGPAERWSVEAATDIYRTVLDVDGAPVTAHVLKGVVRALPPGEYDPEQVADQVRAYLATLPDDGAEPNLPAVSETLNAEAKRIRGILSRIVRQDRVRQHASQRPDDVRLFVKELRQLLDDVERDVLSTEQATDQN